MRQLIQLGPCRRVVESAPRALLALGGDARPKALERREPFLRLTWNKGERVGVEFFRHCEFRGTPKM